MAICRREVEKAMGPLLKYAYSLCRDSDLACDLVQESVVKALSASVRPKKQQSYLSWLFSILRNVFFDHLRHVRRLQEVEQPACDGEIDLMGNPKRVDECLYKRMSVHSGFNRLSSCHQDLLVLIDVMGFTYQETSEIMGVPVGTVMSRLSRARRQLRRELSTQQ